MYRVDVHEVPQVWDSSFLELQDDTTRGHFGYKKKKGRAEVEGRRHRSQYYGDEDGAYAGAGVRGGLSQTAPGVRENHITNSLQFMQNTHFTSFLEALSSVRAGDERWEQLSSCCTISSLACRRDRDASLGVLAELPHYEVSTITTR